MDKLNTPFSTTWLLAPYCAWLGYGMSHPWSRADMQRHISTRVTSGSIGVRRPSKQDGNYSDSLHQMYHYARYIYIGTPGRNLVLSQCRIDNIDPHLVSVQPRNESLAPWFLGALALHFILCSTFCPLRIGRLDNGPEIDFACICRSSRCRRSACCSRYGGGFTYCLASPSSTRSKA